MDAQTVTAWMNEIAASVRAERDYLVQLDAAIGGLELDPGAGAPVESEPARGVDDR